MLSQASVVLLLTQLKAIRKRRTILKGTTLFDTHTLNLLPARTLTVLVLLLLTRLIVFWKRRTMLKKATIFDTHTLNLLPATILDTLPCMKLSMANRCGPLPNS